MELFRGAKVRVIEDIVNDKTTIKKGSILRVAGANYDDFIDNTPMFELRETVEDHTSSVWAFMSQFEAI